MEATSFQRIGQNHVLKAVILFISKFPPREDAIGHT